MPDIGEDTITAAVLARFGAARNPRVKQISEALVRHLHAFVREVRPDQAEWEQAIDFLTRTGQACDALRQEFILLSDVLGVSMLVDTINHRTPGGATETTVLGPFYRDDAPARPLGADLSPGREGMPIFVSGRVAATDGTPLAGSRIDVWHADGIGLYDVQEGAAHAMRGWLSADAEGRFRFWSVRPVSYPVPTDGPVGALLEAQGRHPFRPAHIHFRIAAPGYETLVTHVFAAGDAYLDSDAVFGVKRSLVRDYAECPPGVAPDGRRVDQPFATLAYDFALKPD